MNAPFLEKQKEEMILFLEERKEEMILFLEERNHWEEHCEYFA